jgi:hypothetical protein
MKVRREIVVLTVLTVLTVLAYLGYNYFFKKTSENFLDIDSKIPVYHYNFELPKQPEIIPLELSSVDPVALQAKSVQFKRTDPEGFLKNMCAYRQLNKEENCNSLVGISQRPVSSGNPQVFTDF